MPKLRISGKVYPFDVPQKDVKRLLMLKDLFAAQKLTSIGLTSFELSFIGWLAIEFKDENNIENDFFGFLKSIK